MKKRISIIIAVVAFFCVAALAEGTTFDFSSMTNDELTALIEAAQTELSRRSLPNESQDQGKETGTEGTLYVSEAHLAVQSEEYKSLYPDLLQAILVNDTQDDIKDAVIAFMAWDANGLPVLLKAQFDFNAASYVKRVNYTGINMIPGSTFGEKAGMKVDESIKGIVTVKAIVASYESFDGKTWTNPEYEQFIEQYAGKKLQADD